MALQGTFLDRQDPFAGMVKLAAATFQMGKPEGYKDSFVNDAPLHEVTLSHDFWIGRYPVTERFYAEVLGKQWEEQNAMLPRQFLPPLKPDYFLDPLNKIFAGRLPGGYRFDIPTEAQWEYAAKAGTDGNLPDEIREKFRKSVYCDSPLPVVDYPAGRWGLCGMPGGIMEYCRDLYAGYPPGPVTDPEGPSGPTGPSSSDGHYRVVRGMDGIFRNTEWVCRGNFIGLRLVIAAVDGPETAAAEKWKRTKESYESRARSFFRTLYPDRDVKPLLVDVASDDEFAGYMAFAEQIKEQKFPFEKAEYAILNGLDLATADSLWFCKEMAEEAAKHWDDEHVEK